MSVRNEHRNYFKSWLQPYGIEKWTEFTTSSFLTVQNKRRKAYVVIFKYIFLLLLL